MSCALFARTDLNLDPNRVHRFVVGEDEQPRALSEAEAKEELGDPFATFVLLEGTFPRTAEETVTAIKDAVDEGDPLRNQMTFVLGEGSQIAVDEDSATLVRGLRFVVTLGATADGPPEGPDVLISVFDPRQTGIELMAWDRRATGFNYYRSMGDPPAWVFAGNARHALSDPTQGKGPFESHLSGALLMKELKRPWVHWDSTDAHIKATAFADDDDRREHPWFVEKEPGGAYALEFEVATPAIRRWAKARFDAFRADGGKIDRPARIMEQLLGTPTVNLFSSIRESKSAAASSDAVTLPSTFFVDADGLAEVGLVGPPQFKVAGDVYASSLNRFAVALRAPLGNGKEFVQEGDTHFAFVIPERAFEDLVVLQEAIKIGLLSRRLAACLLMTDFPNPIFSERRASLLAHVPVSAVAVEGTSTFSEEMAQAIIDASANSGEASPEREFAELWNVGESFEDEFNSRLGAYYGALSQRLGTQEGFDDYFRLAESRRQRVREMPIFENPLLFASTNISPAVLAMRADGSVS